MKTFDDITYSRKEAEKITIQEQEGCRFLVHENEENGDRYFVESHYEEDSQGNGYGLINHAFEDIGATYESGEAEDDSEPMELVDIMHDLIRLVDRPVWNILEDLDIDFYSFQWGGKEQKFDSSFYFFDADRFKESVKENCAFLRHNLISHSGRANFHRWVANMINSNADVLIEELSNMGVAGPDDVVEYFNRIAEAENNPYHRVPEDHAEVIEGMLNNKKRPFRIDEELLDIIQ